MDQAPFRFDMRAYARTRVSESAAALAWDVDDPPQDRQAWQDGLRRQLAELLGYVNEWEKPLLNSRVLESRQMDGYRREAISFTTRPGLDAFGYFLIPDDCPMKSPAVLCLPGHGRGLDSIVGIAEDGTQRPLGKPDEYQADFALQCVAHGYPTFALEQISFGHRRDEEAKKESAGASSCNRDSMAALMLGETMTGWRVWDAMRAMDYMGTRSLVDPFRIATMGISGGGLTSLFTGALDPRVKVCVVSGYFNTWAASILAVNHCVDNYVPGLLNLCEMPDMAGLVAPRALFAESGTDDDIFPLPAFEQAVEKARAIYAAFGVPERFDSEVFEGKHQFHGRSAFAFLEQRL